VGEDPADFVDSQNYYRRHLDDSQRAMKAAGLANRRTGQYSRGAVSAQQFGSAPIACPRCGGLRTKSSRDAMPTARRATNVRTANADGLRRRAA
jgi:hypothetical protein